MRVMRIAAIGCVALGAASRVGVAQYSPQQQTDISGQHAHPAPGDLGDSDAPGDLKERMEAQQKRAINDDRHKRLVADTDKLVALANELKAEVAKSQKDELNVVVVRKAAEMEKLAHDVKSRMSY